MNKAMDTSRLGSNRLPEKVRRSFFQEGKLELSLKVKKNVTWQNWKERAFQEVTGPGQHPKFRELQGREKRVQQRCNIAVGKKGHKVLKAHSDVL